MKFITILILMLSACFIGCGEKGSGPENEAGDQVEQQQDIPQNQQNKQNRQSDQLADKQSSGTSGNPSAKTSPQSGSDQLSSGNRSEKKQSNEQKPLSESMPFTSKDTDPDANPFHRIPQFFVNDFVGGQERMAYDALKGMEYFIDSRVIIYITDKVMEGTTEYNRVEAVMKRIGETENMIFVWLHLGNDHTIKSAKTVYSDNLKNRSLEESLTL